jgi:hypothetical protein
VTSDVVKRYLGCGQYVSEANMSASRRLTALYLAAQVSADYAIANPNLADALCKLKLGCFIMPMGGMASPLPVRLSNGFVIDGNTNLQDFFKQTEMAILLMRTADINALIKVYQSLGCGD